VTLKCSVNLDKCFVIIEFKIKRREITITPKEYKSGELLKFLDSFKVSDNLYEAYLLVNGKVMLIDKDGGIVFFGDVEEYLHYKEKLINRDP